MNNLALALGTFDGLHKGHMNVINKTKEIATYTLTPSALVFDRHPQEVLFGKCPPLLITNGDKDRIFRENEILPVGVSFGEIKDYSPEEFVLFTKSLGAKVLVCGENFRFGKKSSGNVQILFELCKKYDIILYTAKSEYFENELISSTRIRTCLQNGDVKCANAMLGRCFSYTFPIKHGKGKGAEWGFPTANQKVPDEFVNLRHGVYATKVLVDGKFYPSVTNFGIRPTVTNSGDTVSETFILGFDGDLYDETLTVEFLDFLRDEMKFTGIEELATQVKKDSKKAAEIFAAQNKMQIIQQ